MDASLSVLFTEKHVLSKQRSRNLLIVRVITFLVSLFFGAMFVKFAGDYFVNILAIMAQLHLSRLQGNKRRLSSILALEWLMIHMTFLMYRHLFSFSKTPISIRNRSRRLRHCCFVVFALLASLAHLTYFFYLAESFEIPWLIYGFSALCNGIWINLCILCFLFTVYNLCIGFASSFTIGQWLIRRMFMLKIVKMFSTDHCLQVRLTLLITFLLSMSHWYFSDKLIVKHQKIFIERQVETKLTLKVAVLTDLHAGASIYDQQISSVVKRVNALDVDAVFLIGDIVDAPRTLIERRVESLHHLQSHLGTFYVTGNHEYYYGNVEEWFALFESYGIRILKNEVIELKGHCVVGLNDITSGSSGIFNHEMDVRAIGICPHNETTIVLAHNPSAVKEILGYSRATSHPVDLILSGHTHNAQYLVLVPFAYFLLPYLYGLYSLADGATKLIVSAGTLYQNAPMKMPFMSQIWSIEVETIIEI